MRDDDVAGGSGLFHQQQNHQSSSEEAALSRASGVMPIIIIPNIIVQYTSIDVLYKRSVQFVRTKEVSVTGKTLKTITQTGICDVRIVE